MTLDTLPTTRLTSDVDPDRSAGTFHEHNAFLATCQAAAAAVITIKFQYLTWDILMKFTDVLSALRQIIFFMSIQEIMYGDQNGRHHSWIQGIKREISCFLV